ncbi:putative disease resistance protein RGA3 [Carex rostrata]
MVGVEVLVGGWFASPVIKSVIEKAQKYLSANYELQKGTQGLVDTLTRTLLLCQATVKEAEKRAIINNPPLADLLRRLKLAVYSAEDVLDNMEAKSIKEKVQGKNKVSKFASSSIFGIKNMFLPDDNHKSLKKVVDELNKLSTDIPKILNLLNLNENYESHDHDVTNQRETISQPLEQVGLYGRQDELSLILEIILGSDSETSKKRGHNNFNGLCVIPIIGIGGVGKTALAQAVYNEPEVQHTFASKAWISVSCNLDVVLLMRKIVQSLGGYLRLDVITLEDISKNLSWIIGGRRFLVVLDDMFEKIEYHWDVIYTTLSHGAPGSVVLITTQNKAFANRVATFNHIALSALEPRIFWKLFKCFAFRNLVMPDEKRNILKHIGKQIAENLRGLPLAAKIIGNILRSNADEERWRRISKSEWWDLPEVKSQILPSIGLGYEYLDPGLRQCFAYCSVFPRNSLLEKDRLVQMWIAQDFVPHDINGMRLEDVGRQWFDKLVEKSFFQPMGDNRGYVMPNLMHDLAIIVSSYECFYLSDESVKIPQGVRHVAIDTKNLEMVKEIQKCQHLRSFFYFGLCHIDGMYSTINESLRCLDRIRVLDLSYLHMETKEPPPAIQNLTHLRFLDLSSTGIEVLAQSSFNHYHLQALHIRKCQFLELPREINKLINLRHLNVDDEKIPLISGIGQLTSLQELDEYAIGEKEGHRITELKNMKEITGHLKIINCENVKSKDEAMQAKLADKKHVYAVDVRWSSTSRKSNNIDLGILDGLKPHNELRELRIFHYMGTFFPDWMMQMSHYVNLQSITLFNCTSIEVLPPLGQLPSLKTIHFDLLTSIKKFDHNIYGNKETVFPALVYFQMNHTSLEEWAEARVEAFFPHLSCLEINANKALKDVPLYRFGASLKTLNLFECNTINSLERSFHHLTCLTNLCIWGSRVRISLSLNDLRPLEVLKLRDCSELSILGELQTLTNLNRIEILNCPKLYSSSQYSTMSRQKGKGLQVQWLENLQSLAYLEMDQSLLHYDYPQILGKLPSLRVLNCKVSQLIQFTRYETLWLEELTKLRELYFANCEFEHLPSSLATLSSLMILVCEFCNNLKSLPPNGMPPFLRELTLNSCPQVLVQRCQPDEGEDWPLISHVPLIRIDGRLIHRPQSSEGTSG